MSFWSKVRKDLEKGIDDGIAFVKEGAAAVLKRAEVLTEEGKKRYAVYDLKTKVRKEISELGGQIYDLSSKRRNPLLDSKVKETVSRLRRLEAEILELEGRQAPAARKTKSRTTVKKTETNKMSSPKTRPARSRVVARGKKAADKEM